MYPFNPELHKNSVTVLKNIFITIQMTLQVFSVGINFETVNDALENLSGWIPATYKLFTAFMYVFAPLLTASFLLSFFQNISSYRQLLFNRNKNCLIFSDLNEKSLTLAKSKLAANLQSKRKAVAIFANVNVSAGEPSAELINMAKQMGGILFKNNILYIQLRCISKKAKIDFFVCGNDDAENIENALNLHNKYSDKSNATLFVFSDSVCSELLLSGKNGAIKVRRIDEAQSLIYHTLYERGNEIFESAYNSDNNKIITAVILGLGQYGSEMLKALTWFTQMDGYDVILHVFDKDEKSEAKFRIKCPELLDDVHNKSKIIGEAQYTIVFHSGTDVDTCDFESEIKKIEHISYVFVSLGDDDKNIEKAVEIRRYCKRLGMSPKIHSITADSRKTSSLRFAANHANEPYNIDFIGDLETLYSDSVVVNSDLEKEALTRHLKWGTEESFWKYNYYYRSSLASVIHKKMKIHCGIKGADKVPEGRTPAEKLSYRILEHRRWNAYMRSDGYVYSGSTDKSTRNDMAKINNLLVPFDELPDNEKAKDDD